MSTQHLGDPMERLFDFIENAPADEAADQEQMDCNMTAAQKFRITQLRFPASRSPYPVRNKSPMAPT